MSVARGHTCSQISWLLVELLGGFAAPAGRQGDPWRRQSSTSKDCAPKLNTFLVVKLVRFPVYTQSTKILAVSFYTCKSTSDANSHPT